MVKSRKKTTEAERTVEEEMGDILFVLICFANSLNIDLQEAHDRVMNKFNTRDKDRWTKKRRLRREKEWTKFELYLQDQEVVWEKKLYY